ncbi:MAG: ABC transporter ATP-binding protein [Deltaproteobacteria bacterium]|nr:ABC transporter ATP-binding protein [Deltaproteobacteria bacterium]
MKNNILEVKGLSKSFGGLRALANLSYDIQKGQIKALIGPNGAGKTTLFNIICGLERADSGNIYFRAADITKRAPEKIAATGISRTFQTTQVFEHLNVVENVMVGRYLKTNVSFAMAGFWLPGVYREEHRNMVKAFEVLEFLGLYEKADRKISQVSFMERKLVELGRALAMEPKVLLLDEPFGGLNAKEGKILSEKIGLLKEQGMSIAMIDHHFGTVARVSDKIAVMHHGQIIALGSPEEIGKDQAVMSAYFSDEEQ